MYGPHSIDQPSTEGLSLVELKKMVIGGLEDIHQGPPRRAQKDYRGRVQTKRKIRKVAPPGWVEQTEHSLSLA